MGTFMQKLFLGHMLLFSCSVFYLAWWYVAFRPQSAGGKGSAGLFLMLTLVLGLASVFFLLAGVITADTSHVFLPVSFILLAGIVLYIGALFVSASLFSRPVTSELLFIVLWLVLEAAVLDVLQGNGLASGIIGIGIAGVLLLSLINMGCYMVYYKLAEPAAFLVGMVPLGLGGIASLVMAVVIWLQFLQS